METRHSPRNEQRRSSAPQVGGRAAWLWASRAAVLTFAVLSIALFALLAMSGAGIGALAGAACLAGVAAIALREAVWRRRERLLAWISVHDDEELHADSYLTDLLSLECERAGRHGLVFSVFVLRLRVVASYADAIDVIPESVLQDARVWVRRLIRRGDQVVLLNAREVAVVAMGANMESRGDILERLRVAVAANVTFLIQGDMPVEVAGGVATYGVETTHPDELLHSARSAVAQDAALTSSRLSLVPASPLENGDLTSKAA